MPQPKPTPSKTKMMAYNCIEYYSLECVYVYHSHHHFLALLPPSSPMIAFVNNSTNCQRNARAYIQPDGEASAETDSRYVRYFCSMHIGILVDLLYTFVYSLPILSLTIIIMTMMLWLGTCMQILPLNRAQSLQGDLVLNRLLVSLLRLRKVRAHACYALLFLLVAHFTLFVSDPTRMETPAPTEEPTKRPRPEPTPRPTPEKSDEDSRDDETPEPSERPTTRRPSPDPTRIRTPKPSDEPTERPRPMPTPSPTPKPQKETPSPSHEPTNRPRPQPTQSPTVHPTHHPTVEDNIDEDSDTLEFVGQCYWRKCRKCQGDCDTDSECGDGLVCLQRKGNDQRVFGCRGTPVRDVDYCIRKEDMDETLKPTNEPSLLMTAKPTPSPTAHPVAQPSNEVDDNGNVLREVESCSEDEPCGACEGDCGGNSDCLGSFRCWKRKNHAKGGNDGRLESVPGCLGQGKFKFDYCYDPAEVVPTPRPTRKPTPLPPTMPTGSVKLTRVGNNLGKYMLAKCEGDCGECLLMLIIFFGLFRVLPTYFYNSYPHLFCSLLLHCLLRF